jgi:hypothetical protein
MVAGLLSLCDLAAADPQPARPTKGAPPVRDERVRDPRAPLLWDAAPVVAKQVPSRAEARGGARPIVPRPRKMHVSMDILVDGRALATVAHAGKTYLPVRELGTEYEIRIWNHGPRRVVAVVSVDGLSVINGKPASENHPGYIVAPYSHILIKGWRRSTEAVAAFRFVERDKSYAGLIGKPENIGVIGLIAIEELVPPPGSELERKGSTIPSGKALRGKVGSIGTEYGREIDSRVIYVPFVRSSNQQTITLYYDTVKALRKAGVPVDPPLPVPFPGDSTFVPPPPGYKGK